MDLVLVWVAVLLGLCLVMSLAIYVRLGQLVDTHERSAEETKQLRLTLRTRMHRASMQSGATTEEQELARLGRISQSRRIVVGGDEDSEQHRDLTRQTIVNRVMRGGEDDG